MATKTRVQVRGTIGKSVLLPTSAAAAAAILGVNVQLPNGSVPTLAQLAAALAGTNTGNIIPPGATPVVIFQNIQNVPANVRYPARPVMQEEDSGEDYFHRAIPGPQGARGATGFSVNLLPDDPEDPQIVPGPMGPRGASGLTVYLAPDDPDDPQIIPGPIGPRGATGLPGTAGASTGPQLWIPQDESEDAFTIPGPPGQQGIQGVPGTPGTAGASTGPIMIRFDEDPDDTVFRRALSYLDIQGLAKVAHSGAYSDLSGLPSIPGSANPTAVVGLTVVNGTAATWMRSDAAPPIDQGISPTWSGTHTYSGGGGIGITMNNSIGIAFKDAGGTVNAELQLFSDNQVYLDNHSSGAAINLRVGAGFAGLHVNMFGVQLDAPQTSGGDTLAVTANADLTGVLINGSANNIGLTINNGQSGALANWRIMSSATGSGFGAGNLFIGRGSSEYTSWNANGSMTVNPVSGADTIIAGNSSGHAAFRASMGGSSYALFASLNGTGSIGLYCSQSAAAAVNAIHINQAGQSNWDIFQPASSNNLQFYNGSQVILDLGIGTAAINGVLTVNGGAGLSSVLGAGGGGGGGVTLNTPAATQINALTLNQTGQQPWILYQPASDNTLRLFAGSDIAVFSANSTTLAVNGIASNYAFQASGVSTGNGVRINAGNAFAQAALNIDNFNATAQLFLVHGDGTVEVGGPSGGALGAGWVNAASGYAINGVPVSAGSLVFSNALTASQGITSNTTVTSSSGLSLPTSMPTGVYQFEAFISVSEVTSSAGGFKFDLAGGGATVANVNIIREFLLSSGSSIAADLVASLSTVESFATVSTNSALPTAILLTGQIQITVAGSFAIRVAQVASSANTTTIAAGSYVKMTKVA